LRSSCNTESEMSIFQRRCQHRVPVKAIVGMWKRWEIDISALRLSPFLESDSAQQADIGGETLIQWISQNQFFGSKGKYRNPTHMMAELEGRPTKFIFIPPERYDEFLERYAADPTHKFLIEFCSSPVNRLFFDLDYVATEELSDAIMLEIVRCLQKTAKRFYPLQQSEAILNVVVTCGAPFQHYSNERFIKSGCHIIFPNLDLTLGQATCIAEAAISELRAVLDEDEANHQRWDQIMDIGIYKGSLPGMRMLGSRKTIRDNKGVWVDYGTGVHTLRAVVDANGELNLPAFSSYAQNLSALMKVASIRSVSSTPTPGFVDPDLGPPNPTAPKDQSPSLSPSSSPAAQHDQSNVSITTVDLEDLHFKPATDGLIDHVINKYLPRKLANLLGISVKEITDDTPVRLSRKHGASEGKIYGMWEQFAKSGIIDLRVDLQPQRKEGHTSHYGDEEFANWQVQFGASKVCKVSSQARPGKTDMAGAFAGVFMRTEVSFSLGDLKRAMALSFAEKKYVYLTRQ